MLRFSVACRVLCLSSVRGFIIYIEIESGGGPVLVPLGLVAVARDVAGLAAHVAGLGAVRAVARDVPGFVAIVTGLRPRVTTALGAVPCNVPSLVAVVA